MVGQAYNPSNCSFVTNQGLNANQFNGSFPYSSNNTNHLVLWDFVEKKLLWVNSITNIIESEINSYQSTGFQYEVGEYVPSEGGIIFHRYLTGTTQKYLVVDLQDLGTAVWSNIDNTANNANSLWNGSSNQSIITSQPGATSGAAFLCEASTNGGKNDWYLPAIQELNKLWCNMLEVSQGLEIAGGNQLIFSDYWSSTETDNLNAWYFVFSKGLIGNFSKNDTSYVRAVRQFSI
jgi:hypothetical protein